MGEAPAMSVIADACAVYGLVLRGGFNLDADEAAHVPAAPGGASAAAIVLVGGAGDSFWAEFSHWLDGEPDRRGHANPLDAWTMEAIAPIASSLSATPVYPFQPPWQPFQRWAQRAESVHASPLGILIHPDYGLWHAYRAALVFGSPLDLSAPARRASPCESCDDKPCLSACPVGAFAADGYALETCAGHLAQANSHDCHLIGCRARDACPVGIQHRYGEDQRRFHMAAFIRARGVDPQVTRDLSRV